MTDENIVKKVCKELGITQKELAKKMGVHEETVSKWSRGIIEIPQMALHHFELLKIEKKYNIIKSFLNDNQL